MSDHVSNTTDISSELMRYLERDATVLGRTVNTVLDWGRDLTGAPSLKTQAAAYDAELLKQRAAQDAVMNHAATVLETSGLSTPNRHHALTLVQGMLREYPSVDVSQMRDLVNRTVHHIQNRIEDSVAQNQLNLFTAEALNHAQPFDREAGLQKLEELAIALQTVENLIDSNQDEKYISAAFNHAEDIAEWVYRDKDACLIAKTWGITPTNLGLPFLNDRGTVLHSTDLTKYLSHEHSLERVKRVERDVAIKILDELAILLEIAHNAPTSISVYDGEQDYEVSNLEPWDNLYAMIGAVEDNLTAMEMLKEHGIDMTKHGMLAKVEMPSLTYIVTADDIRAVVHAERDNGIER